MMYGLKRVLFYFLPYMSKRVNTTYLYLVPRVLGPGAFSGYLSYDPFTQPYVLSWMPADYNMIVQIEWQEAGCLPV